MSSCSGRITGILYAHHPLHLAEQMDDEDSTIVALLHDVEENTNYTLYEKDFSDGIIASVNHDGDRLDMDERKE